MLVHGGDIYTHKNMMDFSSNINHFGIPEGVKKAVADSIEHCTNYPDPLGRELKEAIAKKDGVKPEMIFAGNGAADVIFTLVNALKPKKALLPAPTFYEYEKALTTVDCDIKRFYLTEENGFETVESDNPDFFNIYDDIDIIFLCNPNNPTGTILTRTIKAAIEHYKNSNTLIVVDECFCEFLDTDESVVSYLTDNQNLFIIKAFTKTFAMPGLRLGYGLTSNINLIETMESVSQPWRVSVPATAAGIAACEEGEWLGRTLSEIRKERDKLKKEIEALGFKTYGSNANYIFFKGPDDLSVKLLDKNIIIRDCSNYVGLTNGYYRVAVKSSYDNGKLIDAIGVDKRVGGVENVACHEGCDEQTCDNDI